MTLNTASPPFDDADARRAVAYALDRGDLARLLTEITGRSEFPVSCQVIPPNIPGYAPYCPFSGPGAETEGSWAGPDLSEARDLVRRSGTSGAQVVVAVAPFFEAVGERMVGTLRDLGYRARLTVVKTEVAVLSPTTMPPGADVSWSAWTQIYPSAAEFLVPLLACTEADGTPTVEGVEQFSFNLSNFCDPEIDRRMQRALDRKLTDPYGSARGFAAIDRDLVDLAPMIPVASGTTVQLVSDRVGNVQANPQLGVLLAQVWIR